MTLDKFKAKALLADPAFWVAAAVLIADAFPGVGAWAAAHSTAVHGIWIVLAGHFFVRGAGVVAAGKAAGEAHPDVFADGEQAVDPIFASAGPVIGGAILYTEHAAPILPRADEETDDSGMPRPVGDTCPLCPTEGN